MNLFRSLRSPARTPSTAERVEDLRDQLTRALAATDKDRALHALQELQRLQPHEPRWPHKEGDVLRSTDRPAAAAMAYQRAARRYHALDLPRRAEALLNVAQHLHPAGDARTTHHPMVIDDKPSVRLR